jgi:hypothetical protein
MPQMTLAEELLYTTVKLIAFRNANPISTGTGFFFAFAQEGDQIAPCIVTNKHVVEGADMIRARLHFGSDNLPTGQFVDCNFDTSGGIPFWHPDPAIDLCAFPYADILSKAAADGKQIFFRHLDMGIVPEDDDWEYFDALEEVMMIGCPNGISDEINNVPISRRGITATSITKDYNGKPEFMVDMACFPGSSGSPVFLYDRNGFLDRRSNSYNIGAQRVKLIGVLYAGPLISNDGRIVLSHAPRIEVASMMHLGNVIKSSQLRVLDRMVRNMIHVPIAPAQVGNVLEG